MKAASCTCVIFTACSTMGKHNSVESASKHMEEKASMPLEENMDAIRMWLV